MPFKPLPHMAFARMALVSASLIAVASVGACAVPMPLDVSPGAGRPTAEPSIPVGKGGSGGPRWSILGAPAPGEVPDGRRIPAGGSTPPPY